MNKKILVILIAMVCVLASLTVLSALNMPSSAIWVDSGSDSGIAQDITPSWNANLKYMLFKVKLSDGSLNIIGDMQPLLEYDSVDQRLELISDNAVYVTGMAFTGYTGAVANVIIPSTKTITVGGVDYDISVTDVSNTAFSSSKNFVTSIYFPSSIRMIAASACANMTVLQSVVIESEDSANYSLTINNNAFMSCGNLQTVSFLGNWNTASVININRYAFMACTSLAEMWFNSTSSKTPTFGTYVFAGTTPAFRAYMYVVNRPSYIAAVTAAKAVGFYDVSTPNFDLTTINATLTWYKDKACTEIVATPTSVVAGRYYAK